MALNITNPCHTPSSKPATGPTKTADPTASGTKAPPKADPSKTATPTAMGSKTVPTPEPTKPSMPTAETPPTVVAIKQELEMVAGGRGRAVLGGIARVGGRVFAVLKVGGTLYVIYSLTQIRSLSDAGAFVVAVGVNEVVYGVAKVFLKSGGLAFIITLMVGLEDDQGQRYHEEQRKARAVSAFLEEHFTQKQIGENYGTLAGEAEKLLFETTPFELVPTLEESLKKEFQECMSREYAPVSAGAEAAEKAYNEAQGKCYAKTSYRAPKENVVCTEFGCSPVAAPPK